MKIQESAENYLETILVISKEKGTVRSIDIANSLGFSKPSVSVAMKQFRENGLIVVDGDGLITLTERGREIAERIYERHLIMADCLMMLGVSKETAMADACKLEHALSDESFAALKAHYYEAKQDEEKRHLFG